MVEAEVKYNAMSHSLFELHAECRLILAEFNLNSSGFTFYLRDDECMRLSIQVVTYISINKLQLRVCEWVENELAFPFHSEFRIVQDGRLSQTGKWKFASSSLAFLYTSSCLVVENSSLRTNERKWVNGVFGFASTRDFHGLCIILCWWTISLRRNRQQATLPCHFLPIEIRNGIDKCTCSEAVQLNIAVSRQSKDSNRFSTLLVQASLDGGGVWRDDGNKTNRKETTSAVVIILVASLLVVLQYI